MCACRSKCTYWMGATAPQRCELFVNYFAVYLTGRSSENGGALVLRRKCKLEFRGVHSEQHCHSRTVVQWCGNLPDEWYHGTMCIKSCPCTGERNAIVPLSHSTGRFYQRHSLRSHASACAQKGFVLLVPEGHCLQRRRSGITVSGRKQSSPESSFLRGRRKACPVVYCQAGCGIFPGHAKAPAAVWQRARGI